MVRGQQMMQAGRPTGPAGMQVMSGLRQQGPPNVTVQTPAGQGLMGGPQLWQGQQMGQQQGMTGTEHSPSAGRHSGRAAAIGVRSGTGADCAAAGGGKSPLFWAVACFFLWEPDN